MKLGYVMLPGPRRVDLLLADVARRLEAHGVALAGTVRTNIHRHDRPRCDMDLRLLPDGPVVRISIDRGAEARGCRAGHPALGAAQLAVINGAPPRPRAAATSTAPEALAPVASPADQAAEIARLKCKLDRARTERGPSGNA